MPYTLHIQAYTPRGIFEGRVNKDPISNRAAVENLVAQMQNENLSLVVLFTRTAWDTWREITLRGPVLTDSVLVYEIRESDVLPPSQNG